MSTPHAVILLCAHGNSPYLTAQVRSIVQQMAAEDLLVIVDDGSREVPWDALVPHLPSRYACWSRLQNIGSSQGFMELLFQDAEDSVSHFFLADQDDIWLPGKIALQKQLTPVAGISVHATLADWGLQATGQREQTVTAVIARQSPVHYFFETPAPGMTFCIGAGMRDQLRLAQTILREAACELPHDRIIAGCTGWNDALLAISEPLVLYRQHTGNQIGAAPSGNLRHTMRRLARWPAILRESRAASALATHWMRIHPRHDTTLQPLYRQRLRQSPLENAIMQTLVWLSK